MRKIGYDFFSCDAAKIVEDSRNFLKVNAVISKAGVYKYDDGYALKPTRELLDAAPTARWAKITLHNHPRSKMVMSKRQVFGGVEKPFFERNRIRSILSFDKRLVPVHLIQKIRDIIQQKAGLDVSIGFYYSHDPTPGRAQDVNTGKMRDYDYVMRDIFIDHVAVMFGGNVHGRCTFPNCGIGVDAMLQRISERPFQTDKVVKRGDEWCIVHCHGAKAGQIVKGSCHKNKSETEAMHRAIMARKGSAYGYEVNKTTSYEEFFAKAKIDQDKRPPKAWWESCQSKAKGFATDPDRFCGWLYYDGPAKLKESFGKAAVESPGGMEEEMSLEEMLYPERSKEFNECVTQRMAEGMTQGEAEAHCAAATKPEDEPEPAPGGTLDQEEQSPYQKCIAEQMEAGKTMEEAVEACKAEGVVKGDQDAAFENCVERKMEDEGLSREDAEKECRVLHPATDQEGFEECVQRNMEQGMSREEAEEACKPAHPPAADQEAEKTPMERCVEEQMEQGKTAEEAKTWCEAELAGEHQEVDAMIQRGKELLQKKRAADINKRKRARRHPL